LPEERKYWASWADSVFSQIGVGGKGRVNRSRGECLLIVGSALSEVLEDELEAGHLGVLDSEEAEEAREALSEAVVFFERAKGVGTCENPTEKTQKRRGKRKRGCPEPEAIHDADEEDQEGKDNDDLQALLTEALLTIANLTIDETKREELYARAEKENGGGLSLGLMNVWES
ncbi:hypothetical protein MPER_15626, partial [Moniliophthora perniciosa FA553]